MDNLRLMLKLNSNFVKFIHSDGFPISYLDVHYHSKNLVELRCLVERINVAFDVDTPPSIVELINEGLSKIKEGIKQHNVAEFSYKCGETLFEVSAIILYAEMGEE